MYVCVLTQRSTPGDQYGLMEAALKVALTVVSQRCYSSAQGGHSHCAALLLCPVPRARDQHAATIRTYNVYTR